MLKEGRVATRLPAGPGASEGNLLGIGQPT